MYVIRATNVYSWQPKMIIISYYNHKNYWNYYETIN